MQLKTWLSIQYLHAANQALQLRVSEQLILAVGGVFLVRQDDSTSARVAVIEVTKIPWYQCSSLELFQTGSK